MLTIKTVKLNLFIIYFNGHGESISQIPLFTIAVFTDIKNINKHINIYIYCTIVQYLSYLMAYCIPYTLTMKYEYYNKNLNFQLDKYKYDVNAYTP